MIELHEGFELREIPNEPGFFAREDGTIWTTWSVRDRSWKHRGWIKGEELLPVTITSSYTQRYCYVRLYTKQYTLHSAMLLAFVGPLPAGLVSRHYPDRNPANCAIWNLHYGSQSDNQFDSLEHGTHVGLRTGESHHAAAFTNLEAMAIREDYASGLYTMQDLADRHKVSKTTIRRVLNFKRYTDTN